jgi:hypothetical protein
MSDPQLIWTILWDRAARTPEPFEVAEVVPEVAAKLPASAQEATRRINLLLGELERLPEGRRYFAREGGAVVALPEFRSLPKDADTARKTYPFEY